MKRSKILRIILCLCIFSASSFAGAIAGILDERNLLSDNFRQHWNNTIFEAQDEYSVRITVQILGGHDQNSETANIYNIPEISVIHNKETGFEIYLENFEGESDFIISTAFFTHIIPEANSLFENGEFDAAVEYILMNILEMLRLQNQALISDIIFEELNGAAPFFRGLLILSAVILILLAAFFALAVFMKKSKPQPVNKTLQELIDFFGSHLLSVSSCSSELKPMLLVQIDEPFVKLIDDKKVLLCKKTMPKILRGNINYPIHIITALEITTFAENSPIEFLHIKNNYRKLFGDDPIAKTDVDFDNLHYAVSTDLQKILINLRAAYLSQNYDDLFVAKTIKQIYMIFEATLFLRSQSIPTGLSELVFKVESSYNHQDSVLSKIAKKIENKDIKGISENMLSLITTLEKTLSKIKGISRLS